LDVAGGFFQKKIVLHSEYGVVIGETAASTTNGGAVLSLNDFKFIYRWQNSDLLLYDKNGMQLSQVNIDPAEPLHKLEEYALLFSHAWFVSSNLSQSKADLKVA
ncbi:MAG TPA: hypothetical protein VMR70_18580, partial [Flavisolibacter sp.]|nr:hypothetical protein [Flavisolibacter sp.]